MLFVADSVSFLRDLGRLQISYLTLLALKRTISKEEKKQFDQIFQTVKVAPQKNSISSDFLKFIDGF